MFHVGVVNYFGASVWMPAFVGMTSGRVGTSCPPNGGTFNLPAVPHVPVGMPNLRFCNELLGYSAFITHDVAYASTWFTSGFATVRKLTRPLLSLATSNMYISCTGN